MLPAIAKLIRKLYFNCMANQTRFLIVYETGGIWEMPLGLFLNYEEYASTVVKQDKLDCYSIVSLEQWFDTLAKEDQIKVIKM